MSILKRIPVMVLFLLAAELTSYGQKIEVVLPEGVKKEADMKFSIGGDLDIMLQFHPRSQYVYEDNVTADCQGKQKELKNIKYPVKKKELFKDKIAKGLKGHGFVLIGENDKGETLAICNYYLEKGDKIVCVTIMGNGLTYEANTKIILEMLKAIKVKE